MLHLEMNLEEFSLFRSYIEKKCSISLSDEKKYLVETRLTRLVVESGSDSFLDFYRKLSAGTDPQLRDKIIDAITTNETLWFRDTSPWVSLRDKLLPELAKRKAAGSLLRVRIWCAACSTGQEPYSLAMLIDDFCRQNPSLGLRPADVEIQASDISPAALTIAKHGRYDRISMRRGFTGEWERYRDEYFAKRGPVAEIDDKIRGRVRFFRFNLQESFAALGQFDVVMLRNVAIYFSQEFKQDLFRRVSRALHKDGVLILGSTESLNGLAAPFSPERFGRAFHYRNDKGGR